MRIKQLLTCHRHSSIYSVLRCIIYAYHNYQSNVRLTNRLLPPNYTMAKENKNLYAVCDHIQRTKPDIQVTEEIAKDIGGNYRTLPAFEKGLFDYVYRRHYSIEKNEFLKCRWLQYKKNIEQRVFAPFQFPCIRDLHFHNAAIRFLPSESIYRYPEHKMKLKPGPGVDFHGQMPIPQELLMKRGTTKKDGVIKKHRLSK